ncbi:RNAse PH [Abditibacterium utsteinense]|uniref:Ribonuclease PH n=1 Tax=Abditibacterium utsteinense TaxID=1960156 RepID=A0A2S8SQN6_9BACT|nr:ribonuclease PH [Abditibacterium utsteinense]PQV63098.1 RNAse PH [Abditibacterium utsteinense]
MRPDSRQFNQLRPLKLTPGWAKNALGSCLIEAGDTKLICTATLEKGVPPWLRGSGKGWLTAEYGMLPGSTQTRKSRDGARGKFDGRTVEIQRLIGRSLRACINLESLGERVLTLDCDVLQADGGTRCAAITGAYVALHEALFKLKSAGEIADIPLRFPIAAVSVGIAGGEAILDLNYAEDKDADVDMNVVMNAQNSLIEVQASAEGTVFSRDELSQMLDLAEVGIAQLIAAQNAAIAQFSA